jgi:hypothetical protein
MMDRKHQTVEDDDRYIAQLLSLYGDADESARMNWRETQQNHQQDRQQPQKNAKTEVKILKYRMIFLSSIIKYSYKIK